MININVFLFNLKELCHALNEKYTIDMEISLKTNSGFLLIIFPAENYKKAIKLFKNSAREITPEVS